MTDACRRMVSRNLQPKLTKFGEHVSIGQTPNHAQISSRSVKRCTRKALYNFFTLHYFGVPVKFTNLGDDV